MKNKFIAEAKIRINAPVDAVWDALVKPEKIKKYFFGTDVETDWKEGSSIFWRGEWQGKKYEDKGKILKIEKEKILQYSHFSPISGMPDKPENYHTVTVKISGNGKHTDVLLTQDGSKNEKGKEYSEKKLEHDA